MDVNIDMYYRNLRMFYQQLIKGHPREDHLAQHFKKMLENQTRKWKKGFGIRGEAGRAAEGAGLLAKLKDKQKAGTEKQKINVEVLFASSQVTSMVVFGYCYLLLEYKNAQALQVLSEGLKQPLSNRQVFSDMMLRKVRTLWDKMQQIVSGRRKIVRFQRQLEESFKEMPQVLIDTFYKVIVHGQEISTEKVSAYLEQISKLLTIKIEYFQINGSDNLKFSTYGVENKITMRFGLFVKDKIFGYVSKLPEKQQVQINKEATLAKFASISEELNSMYAANLKEYMGLSNLKVCKLVRSDSRSTSLMDMGNSKFNAVQRSQSQYTAI